MLFCSDAKGSRDELSYIILRAFGVLIFPCLQRFPCVVTCLYMSILFLLSIMWFPGKKECVLAHELVTSYYNSKRLEDSDYPTLHVSDLGFVMYLVEATCTFSPLSKLIFIILMDICGSFPPCSCNNSSWY